jgi:hypothetical protein
VAGRPRGAAEHLRAALLLTLGIGCALGTASCGNTLQSQPLSGATLEPLVMAEHLPVYWLGARFHGMALTAASSDLSGAYSVQYGGCRTGGPETCVPPLQVISSPDNSFLPGEGGGDGGGSKTAIRGVSGTLLDGGRVVEIATGGAVVDVRAVSPALALAAAGQMVPINELERPGSALPKPLPNTGFAQQPTEAQRLLPLRGLTTPQAP